MSKRELLEEQRSRAVEERSAHSLAASDYFDKLALVQRLEHLPAPTPRISSISRVRLAACTR
jgi:hypothetical protein